MGGKNLWRPPQISRQSKEDSAWTEPRIRLRSGNGIFRLSECRGSRPPSLAWAQTPMAKLYCFFFNVYFCLLNIFTERN